MHCMQMWEGRRSGRMYCMQGPTIGQAADQTVLRAQERRILDRLGEDP